jgi:hypothetical protein
MFDLGKFLEANPDQLAIIKPLMMTTDPTSPKFDYRLERLANARSEGEARLILAVIRESEKRWRTATANTLGFITGGALAIAVDTVVLFVLVYAIAELRRVLAMATPAKQPETDWFGSNRRRL